MVLLAEQFASYSINSDNYLVSVNLASILYFSSEFIFH